MKKNSILFIVILLALKGFSQTPNPVDLESGANITNQGYILYPSPDTDFANIIEVGPGKTYNEIHDIPTSSIVKNTLVKIYHREDPYRTKVFVDVIGSKDEKVRFQGIPDGNGDLPVISFENATVWGNTTNSTLASGSAFIVYGPWANKPAWVEIVNLHIKDAPYAGVWAKGDHISVKGCILENNANGVFFQAANQLLIEISTYILIEGSKFVDNGTVNGWLHHNIYAQGMHTLIQFNTIQKLRTGSLGASLKDRSSHTVIRYNYVETSTRTLDLVEPEDTDQVLTTTSNWDDVYVYGNMLVNTNPPVNGAGVNMVHYGYDNVPTYRREGTLHFYNNTIFIDRNDGIWRVNLFDVNSNNSVVEFSNNILSAVGMQTFYMFRSNNTDNAGSINFDTSYFSISNTQNNWQLTENDGDYFMTGESTIIEGTDPGFVDPLNGNYTLSSTSPCIGNGVDLFSSMNLSVNFNSISTLAPMNRVDLSNPSLGSFAYDTTASTDDLNVNDIAISNYPNPFNESTIIEFTLRNDTDCHIKIFNALGQEVRTLNKGKMTSGKHSLTWDGTNDHHEKVAQGVYYCSIHTPNNKTYRTLLFY